MKNLPDFVSKRPSIYFDSIGSGYGLVPSRWLPSKWTDTKQESWHQIASLAGAFRGVWKYSKT